MKVHQVTRVTPEQEILETGAKPLTKATIPAQPMDSRMRAAVLVSSVMAHVVQDSSFWHRAAVQLIQGETDFRAAFVKTMSEQLKDVKRRNAEAFGTVDKDGKPDPTKGETKLAGSRVQSATVQVSKLTTIAKAFNAGATLEGLLTHFAEQHKVPVKQVTLDAIGYEPIVEYARKFSEAKAGRKPDAWLVKFGKWLDSAGKVGDDASAEEQAQYAKAVAFFNSLKG